MNSKQAKRLRRCVDIVYSANTEEQRRFVYQTAKDRYQSLRSDHRPRYMADMELLAEIRLSDPTLPMEKLGEALQVAKAMQRVKASDIDALAKATDLSTDEATKALITAVSTFSSKTS